MSEENTQAVVDKPDAAAKPAVEGTDARDTGDDLEALLQQFDTNAERKPEPVTASKPEQTPGTEQIDPKKIAADVRAEIEADTRFKSDVAKTVTAIRGDVDPEIADDRFVRAYLDAEAEADPRLAQAFRERNTKPREFAKVTEQLAKKFAAKFSRLPDKAATEDHEAVAAAVRGASNRAPEGKAPDYSKSSNHDFRKSVEEQFGYSPRV